MVHDFLKYLRRRQWQVYEDDFLFIFFTCVITNEIRPSHAWFSRAQNGRDIFFFLLFSTFVRLYSSSLSRSKRTCIIDIVTDDPLRFFSMQVFRPSRLLSCCLCVVGIFNANRQKKLSSAVKFLYFEFYNLMYSSFICSCIFFVIKLYSVLLILWKKKCVCRQFLNHQISKRKQQYNILHSFMCEILVLFI